MLRVLRPLIQLIIHRKKINNHEIRKKEQNDTAQDLKIAHKIDYMHST